MYMYVWIYFFLYLHTCIYIYIYIHIIKIEASRLRCNKNERFPEQCALVHQSAVIALFEKWNAAFYVNNTGNCPASEGPE